MRLVLYRYDSVIFCVPRKRLGQCKIKLHFLCKDFLATSLLPASLARSYSTRYCSRSTRTTAFCSLLFFGNDFWPWEGLDLTCQAEQLISLELQRQLGWIFTIVSVRLNQVCQAFFLASEIWGNTEGRKEVLGWKWNENSNVSRRKGLKHLSQPSAN